MIQAIEGGSARWTEPILRALPSWFGIDEALTNYVRVSDSTPTLIAFSEEAAVGFLTTLVHSPYAAEVFVMAVHPDHHRVGVGSALLAEAEARLRSKGCEYLQVKTLAESHPNPGYQATRGFYFDHGFRPLEVFPALWDEHNPCLLMVKRL